MRAVTKRTLESESIDGQFGPWAKRKSQKHNKDYWYNEVTQQSVWNDPAANKPTFIAAINDTKAENLIVAKDRLSWSINDGRKWIKSFSKQYEKYYWYNESTRERTWHNPVSGSESSDHQHLYCTKAHLSTDMVSDEIVPQLTRLVLHVPADIETELERERKAVAVNEPTCPREIDTADLIHIVHRLRTETAKKETMSNGFEAIFTLSDDNTAVITRAIQEDQILKTRLKAQKGESVVDMPSFWDVWQRNPDLRNKIISSADPLEMKWKCAETHNYKMATTFMPLYAKALCEHFNAQSVLDPCAGWGDRLVGAACSSTVQKYVAFDPNSTLRPGT